MINDGVAANAVNVSSNNFWDALSASTMLIPVGVSNVSDVSTMLSNIWGGANASDTVITFNFGTTSNASVFNNIVSVGLVNSGNATSSPSGQIGSAVDCATAVPCGTSNRPSGSASGRLAPSSTMAVSLSTNNGLTFNPANLIVTTANLANNVFGGTTNAYTSIGSGSYSGTSGSLSLYSQDFLLNSLVAASAGEYLVSIKLQEKSGSSPSSQTALSAITIDAAASAVPEPATVFLLMTGLGAIGLARFRRT
jgi:PEP-CTERM motif-containing protein